MGRHLICKIACQEKLRKALCTTIKAVDVTDTLELELDASGCNSATVVHMSEKSISLIAVVAVRSVDPEWIEEMLATVQDRRDA